VDKIHPTDIGSVIQQVDTRMKFTKQNWRWKTKARRWQLPSTSVDLF
jgi:hypothetical protein